MIKSKEKKLEKKKAYKRNMRVVVKVKSYITYSKEKLDCTDLVEKRISKKRDRA